MNNYSLILGFYVGGASRRESGGLRTRDNKRSRVFGCQLTGTCELITAVPLSSDIRVGKEVVAAAGLWHPVGIDFTQPGPG